MFPVIKQVLGMELRRRWYRHCGSKGEVLQTLSEYGLEADHLPTVLGGSWVRSSVWIDERRLLEHARDEQQDEAAAVPQDIEMQQE